MIERFDNVVYNYKLEPGDGTCYRFGFQYYPVNPDEAYVMDSGVGLHAYRGYIWFYIKMSAGSGAGTVLRNQLTHIQESHVISYLKGHGFGQVDHYTLMATLLALQTLMNDPAAIEEAKANMLKTPQFL